MVGLLSYLIIFVQVCLSEGTTSDLYKFCAGNKQYKHSYRSSVNEDGVGVFLELDMDIARKQVASPPGLWLHPTSDRDRTVLGYKNESLQPLWLPWTQNSLQYWQSSRIGMLEFIPQITQLSYIRAPEIRDNGVNVLFEYVCCLSYTAEQA